MAADLKLVDKAAEYPARLSPVALTFEAEIKRIAADAEVSIDEVMRRLSKFSGIGTSQLYNYRAGKTSIPVDHIPIFCRQFHSNALAMSILTMCEATEIEHQDDFDLTRFCSSSVRDMLQLGDQFMEAFEDGRIDGHEETKLNGTAARIIRSTHRSLEIVRAARNRGRDLPTAA